MGSVRPCLPEQPHGLRPDAVKGEEAVEIRRQVRDGAVTGVEERASRGPADLDTVEGGAAILGVDHAPRIGTASSDWLRDSRGYTDDVDLDPPIHGFEICVEDDVVTGVRAALVTSRPKHVPHPVHVGSWHPRTRSCSDSQSVEAIAASWNAQSAGGRWV